MQDQLSNVRIAGVAVLLFSAVLLGVGIHHVVETGTCSSTGYSPRYGRVPTCPSGTGWWFAFVFGGIIGGLIGALMAGSLGLVFAGIFGAIGFGALSVLFDSSASSGAKFFGAIFGGCFALVGITSAGGVIVSAVASLRSSSTGSSSGKTKMARTWRRASQLDSSPASAAFGAAPTEVDPLVSAYDASGSAAPNVPERSQLGLAPGLRAALQKAATDPVDELSRLADLHQRGALTDEEFANAKAKLLEHM